MYSPTPLVQAQTRGHSSHLVICLNFIVKTPSADKWHCAGNQDKLRGSYPYANKLIWRQFKFLRSNVSQTKQIGVLLVLTFKINI